MGVRPFRIGDETALAALAATSARSETDFVLNPMWDGADEVLGEFERHGIDPTEHLLVAEDGDALVGVTGFVRAPGSELAGLVCPVVSRAERGRGLGGELLRTILARGAGPLGIRFVSAAIGARNHAGYALLAGQGFRPVRQHVLMRCEERPDASPPPVAGLRFEPALPSDAPAIQEIYDSCGFEARPLDTTRRFLADRLHAHCVAWQGERVVAFVELETHWPRRPWVAYVGVERTLRDRGVGSGLVGWALGRQFEKEATSALLMLSPANRTAFRAYEKVGFRRFRMVDVLEKRL